VTALLYQPSTNNYASNTGAGPFTRAMLTTFVQSGDTLTVMGVPLGSGNRMALQAKLASIGKP